MTIAQTTTLKVDFVSESAAYESIFGWYNKVTGDGGILFRDVEAEGRNAPLVAGQSTTTFTVNTSDVGNIEFFLIADGANINEACDLTDPIKVVRLNNGAWAVATVETNRRGQVTLEVLEGAGANAFFTETSKNAGGVDYASGTVGANQTAATLASDTANGAAGLIAWEDLAAKKLKNGTYSAPGDADYNDAVFRVSIVSSATPPVARADAISIGEDAGAVQIDVLTNDSAGSAGSALVISAVNAGGILGTVSIASGGQRIIYTPSSAFQALRAGQTATETFTYTISDGAGGTATAQATVTIAGANDAAVVQIPTIANLVQSASPAATLSSSGVIGISDPDAGEAGFVPGTFGGGNGGGGALGSLVVATNGSYTYSVPNAAVQFLGQGQTLTETFTISTIDGTSVTISFTIVGINDAAVIGAPSVSEVTEDILVDTAGNLTSSGVIAISDLDAGEARFISAVAQASAVGTLALAANGTYTYTVSNAAIQYLRAGQSKIDTFTVTSTDGTSRAISFTIHGADDAAVIGAPTLIDVTEDVDVDVAGNLTASGTISVVDPDLGQAQFLSAAGQTGNLGTLVVNANGGYTYSVSNSAVQYLRGGESKIETFTITSVDGTSRSVTFTIHGSNDAAIVGAPTLASVTEDVNVGADGQLTAIGTISITDADAGEGVFLSATPGNGALGSLSLSADGAYTYSVANASVQALAQGQIHTDAFTITSVDGTTRVVTFTITGSNDQPIAVSDLTVAGALLEAGVTQPGNAPFTGTSAATGNVLANDTDIDTTDQLIVVGVAAGALANVGPGNIGTSLQGVYGNLSVNSDGAWTYTLNNIDSDTQALAAGQSASDVFSYVLSDGHGGAATSTLTVRIAGTNDAPVITGGLAAGTVVEDAANQRTVSGQLTAFDPDAGASIKWTADGGNAALPASYAFRLEKLTIARPNGTVLFSDDFDDGLPPPSGNYGTTGTFTETGGDLILSSANAVPFSGINGPDPLVGQSALARTDITTSTTAGLKVGTGFVVNGVFDLVLPDSPREEYGIRLTDRLQGGTGAPADQVGNNIAALVVRLGNDGNLYAAIRYIDNVAGTNAILQSIQINPPAAADQISLRFSHAANATTASASFDFLSGGQVVGPTQSFSVAPTIFNGEAWIRADVVAYAPTTTDSLVSGTYGMLDVTQGGSWNYALDNSRAATQALAAGQSVTETFVVRATDELGASGTRNITVTVSGTNDAITGLTGNESRNLTEGQASVLAASGLSTFDDVDLTDTHSVTSQLIFAGPAGAPFFVPTQIQDALQHALAIALLDAGSNGHGSYRWDFAVDNALIASLNPGQALQAFYRITVDDHHGSVVSQDVSILITGAGNSPVVLVSGPETRMLQEGAASQLTTSGITSYNDADFTDTHSITPTLLGATLGAQAFTPPPALLTRLQNAISINVIDPDGDGHAEFQWSFSLGDSEIAFLSEQQLLQLSYNIAIDDHNGSVADQFVMITIVGAGNRPVVIETSDQSRAVYEGAGEVLGASGITAFSDGDVGDTHTVSALLQQTSINGVAALFPFDFSEVLRNAFSTTLTDSNGDGHGEFQWNFALADVVLRALNSGQTLRVDYVVTVDDHNGSTDSQTVSIDIVGTGNLISGTPYPDYLIGTQGDDQIFGLAGNDVLIGNGGNDLLVGGEGTDIALYAGTASSYVVGAHSVSGSEGNDTLTGVELLQFADVFQITADGRTADLKNMPLGDATKALLGTAADESIRIDVNQNARLIDLGGGTDTITFSTAGFQNYHLNLKDVEFVYTADAGGGIERVWLQTENSGGDQLVVDLGTGYDEVILLGEADTVVTLNNVEVITGSMGHDTVTIFMNDGQPQLSPRVALGQQNDTLIIAGTDPTFAMEVYGNTNIIVRTSEGAREQPLPEVDMLAAGNDDLTLLNAQNGSFVDMGAGSQDTLRLSSRGITNVVSVLGVDHVYGSAYVDDITVKGNDGNSGSGVTHIVGGLGADIIRIEPPDQGVLISYTSRADSAVGSANRDKIIGYWDAWSVLDFRGLGLDDYTVVNEGNGSWVVKLLDNNVVVMEVELINPIGTAPFLFEHGGPTAQNIFLDGATYVPPPIIRLGDFATPSPIYVPDPDASNVSVPQQILPSVGGAITGTLGPEWLVGTPADETITALGGNDVLIGNGGTDILIGGSGIDVARFLFGPMSAYTIDGNTVTGAEGTATVSGIELLQFFDSYQMTVSDLSLVGLPLDEAVPLHGTAADDVLSIDENQNGRIIDLAGGTNTINLMPAGLRGYSLELKNVAFVNGGDNAIDDVWMSIDNEAGQDVVVDLGIGYDELRIFESNVTVHANNVELIYGFLGTDHVEITMDAAGPQVAPEIRLGGEHDVLTVTGSRATYDLSVYGNTSIFVRSDAVNEDVTLLNEQEGSFVDMGAGANDVLRLTSTGAMNDVSVFDVEHVFGSQFADRITIKGDPSIGLTEVIGGGGADILIVDPAAQGVRFHYTSLSDSGVGGGNRDVVHGYWDVWSVFDFGGLGLDDYNMVQAGSSWILQLEKNNAVVMEVELVSPIGTAPYIFNDAQTAPGLDNLIL